MELDEKDKKRLIIIFILLLTIIGLYINQYYYIKKVNDEYAKQKNKEAKEIIEQDIKEKEEKPHPKRGVIISYIKDYMLNNNMANESNIFIWEVTSVKLYKDESNKYYYIVDGYYKCKEGSTCIDGLVSYPDINGNYDWGMVISYDIITRELGNVYKKNTINIDELTEEISNVE